MAESCYAEKQTITGKQLIDAKGVAAKLGCDWRTVARLADAGRMPWGCKVGALRRWEVGEVDAWIADGCPAVRQIKGATR